jgi:hypothetical protein
MATNVFGTFYSPMAFFLGQAAGSTAFTFAFNHVDDQLYIPFVARQSTTVTDWEWLVSAEGGGGVDLDVGISEIDANGRPTGVAAAGGAYETIAPSGTGRKTGSFSTPATVVAGTQYAFHIKVNTLTGTTTLNLGFNYTSGDQARYGAHIGQNNGGTWGLPINSIPRMGAYYADGEGVSNLIQEQRIIASLTNASTPNEYATKFSVPVSTTINAITVQCSPLVAAATLDVRLYDTDGTTTLAGPFTFTGNYDTGRIAKYIQLASDVTLTAGGEYRIGVKATNASLISLWGIEFDDTGQRNAALQNPQAVFQGSTRKDAGAWTDDPLQMIMAGVHIKSLNLTTPGSCSAVNVSYGAWTRTGPNNTPWTLAFLATDGDNPVTNFELWTGAGRTGTQVASGAASSTSPNHTVIQYDAPGLVDGDQTLQLSVDDGLGGVGSDCAVALRRDDVDPTAATGITVSDP